jgi:hypothetical protein
MIVGGGQREELQLSLSLLKNLTATITLSLLLLRYLLVKSPLHTRDQQGNEQCKRAAIHIQAFLPAPSTLHQKHVMTTITQMHFRDQLSLMEWKLTSHSTYTINSFYNFFAGTGKIKFVFPPLWKTKALHQ